VRLVIEVNDANRVVRVERTQPAFKQHERATAVFSQWGTAPDVVLPPQETVANPKDVVARRG
jgi:tryptophan 2,3-dioxygenase